MEVKTIGLHIGGGPNDGPNKNPIKAAVRKRYDALRSCYANAEDKKNKGTFSLDFRIPKAGGKAPSSHRALGSRARVSTSASWA